MAREFYCGVVWQLVEGDSGRRVYQVLPDLPNSIWTPDAGSPDGLGFTVERVRDGVDCVRFTRDLTAREEADLRDHGAVEVREGIPTKRDSLRSRDAALTVAIETRTARGG